MKTLIKFSLIFLLGAVSLTSCSPDEKLVVEPEAPTLSQSDTEQYSLSSWENLGGVLDGAVWTKRKWLGNWGGWTSLGGTIPEHSKIKAIYSNGAVHLFVKGMTGAVYHQKGIGYSWPKKWTSLGGLVATDCERIEAIKASSSQIQLYVVGTNRQVYTKTGNGYTWNSSWKSLGGSVRRGSNVEATFVNNRSYVFMKGQNSAIYYKILNNVFNSPWISTGGYSPGDNDIAVVSPTANRLDLFMVGNGKAIFRRTMIANKWQSWSFMGSQLANDRDMAIVSDGNNKMHIVYTRLYNQTVYKQKFSNGYWTAFKSEGGQFIWNTDAAIEGSGVGMVVRGTNDNAVYYRHAN